MVSDRNLPGAETALKKSIQCDPGYSAAFLKLGELYNIESRFCESAPLLQEGLRRQPKSWKFHYQLGVAYFGLGDYDKAQEEYVRSEALDPLAPPEVHVKLADVYFKQSMVRQAYAELHAYLAAEADGRLAGKGEGYHSSHGSLPSRARPYVRPGPRLRPTLGGTYFGRSV